MLADVQKWTLSLEASAILGLAATPPAGLELRTETSANAAFLVTSSGHPGWQARGIV